jgi:hypothetical protein
MAYHGADPNAFDGGTLVCRGPARRGEIMRLKIRASMTLALTLMAGSAGAQFQYTPPGGPEETPASRQEALELKLEQARFRLGPVRVAPWATLRDVAYIRSVFAEDERPPSDVTATVGAGFRAYLRNGPKATWSLGVLPEYVWWRQQSDRRRVNGRYQLGFHGFFNRLTLEAIGGREQQLKIVTPEVPVLANARSDGGEILTELEVTAKIFAFASAAVTRQENLADEGDPRLESLSLLDREERISRLGLRWQPREEWSIALGVEETRVDFDRTSVERSNQGTSPLAQVRFRGRRTGFEGEVAFRSLEARQGSEFVPYDEVTGSAALLLGAGGGLSGSVYASRNLIYALAPGFAYLQDDRLGGAVQVSLGHRTRARVFFETGTNDYTSFAPGVPPRSDDVSSYGTGLTLDLGRQIAVGLQALRTEIDSALPGADRTFTAVGLTVNLGGR